MHLAISDRAAAASWTRPSIRLSCCCWAVLHLHTQDVPGWELGEDRATIASENHGPGGQGQASGEQQVLTGEGEKVGAGHPALLLWEPKIQTASRSVHSPQCSQPDKVVRAEGSAEVTPTGKGTGRVLLLAGKVGLCTSTAAPAIRSLLLNEVRPSVTSSS